MAVVGVTDAEPDDGVDVAVVGGGPAGCAAAIFTARADLATVVFDRGRSSLRQCAHLQNYPGFPGGIDVETFYDLLHAHVETAGCALEPAFVDAVTRATEGPGFLVETDDGGVTRARRVVAATRYDSEYLRPLDDGEMYTEHEHGGEVHEHFDREFADADGRTPVDGLYVASPVGERSYQVVTAAGQGARVGRTVVGDVRREEGYPGRFAEHVDWLRRESARDPDLDSRAAVRAHFEAHLPDDHGLDPSRLEDLLEAAVDDRLDSYLTDEEVAERRRRAHDRLLEHLDDDRIRAYLDREAADGGPGAGDA